MQLFFYFTWKKKRLYGQYRCGLYTGKYELGDDGRNYENEQELSTYGLSTANSTKSLLNPPIYVNAEILQLQQKNEGLVQENIRLMKELISANEAYQELLKKCLEEKKTHVNLIKCVPNMLQNVNSIETSTESSGSLEEPDLVTNNEFKELHQWLKGIGVDEEAIKKFAVQKYTKGDVLTLMSREDLRCLGLRGGTELKIWHHIINHRKQNA